MARGQLLLVALASNSSTGFSWYIERAGPALQVVEEPEYLPPGSTWPVVGAPGTQAFTFVASATGTAQLVLEYRGSFEPDAPATRTFRLTAEVHRGW